MSSTQRLLATPAIALMDNPIKDYAWGSTTALAAMQGRPPADRPEAELWMGGHPSAPSRLLPGGSDLDRASRVEAGAPAGWAAVDSDPESVLTAAGELLPAVIEADPDRVLGAAVHRRFGPRLPYMVKLLAIAHPLSLQVHPDADRARAVYTGEAGSPYVDPYAKPELLHALEPVQALFGFRPAAEAAGLIGQVRTELLRPVLDDLAAGSGAPASDASALHAALARLASWPAEERADLVDQIVAGLPESPDDEFGWVRRLAAQHPADPLVLAPLLMDLLQLMPGESLFVPPGVPHSYLTGVAIEVLAASDNVVRAGLTPKQVNVEELLAIVDCTPHPPGDPPQKVAAGEPLGPYEVVWSPGVDDFRLSRIRVPFGVAIAPDPLLSGAQVFVCTHGTVQLSRVVDHGEPTGDDERGITLTAGRSAFVSASAGQLVLTGEGEVFRAVPGMP